MPDIAQSEVDALGAFKHLAGKYGGNVAGIEAKIDKLERDNATYRATITELEGKQPKDGQVIVSKQDADDLAAFRAINAKPADLQKIVEAGAEAQAKLANRELRDSLLGFVKAAGLHEETVDTLVAIPDLKGAKFEVKKGKIKDGKGNDVDGEIAYITLPGDNQTAMKFDDAKEKVPVLKGLRAAEATGTKTPVTKPFVPQFGQETPQRQEQKQDTSPLDAAIQRNKERAQSGSPLRRPKQSA